MKETNENKEDDNIISRDNIINYNNNNMNKINNVNKDDLPKKKNSIFKSIFGVKGEWVLLRLD